MQNNTFAFATGALILVDRYSEEYSRVFAGNTYVQTPGRTGVHLLTQDVRLTLEEGTALLGDSRALILTYP